MGRRNYITEPLRVFIGVGHGGADPGAVRGDIKESDCNLSVALAMEQELQRYGVKVRLSRYGDETDRLRQEIAECNAYQPELAVEIHTNAGGGSGFEALCRKGSWASTTIAGKLAKLLQTHIKQDCNMPVRGIHFRDDLGWLNAVEAPAVICENFFIDGPNAAKYAKPAFLKQIGRAYARAVMDLYGIPYQMAEQNILRFTLLQADGSKKTCGCRSALQEGFHYVQLRQIAATLGYQVYWDGITKETTVYPTGSYQPSSISGGLLPVEECRDEARILNGF